MTDLLSRIPLAWPFLLNVAVALSVIAVAHVHVARRAPKTPASTTPHRAADVYPPSDPDHPAAMRDAATRWLPDDGRWLAPLSADAWSAMARVRAQRLATLSANTAVGFDAAYLIRRAMYSSYMDCRAIGLQVEPQTPRRAVVALRP